MQEVPLNNERQPGLQTGVIACCSAIHQSVERNSVRYFEELRRHNYVSQCIPGPGQLANHSAHHGLLPTQGHITKHNAATTICVTSAVSVPIPPALHGLEVLLMKKQAWIVESE